jgi:hypothetical protein
MVDGMLTIARFVMGNSHGSRSGWFTCCWPTATANTNRTTSPAAQAHHLRGMRIADDPIPPSEDAAWYTSIPPSESVTTAVPRKALISKSLR